MQQGNPWDNDAIVAPGGAMVVTKPASPKLQYEAPQAAATLAEARARAQKAAVEAPFDARRAAADTVKAEADASVAQGKADEAKATTALASMSANSDVHGDAYLKKYVPPQLWSTVKAYARGDIGSRSGGMSTSMLPIIQHAMNYDPSASATTFPARAKMQADLAGNQPGTAGGSLRAMERMLLHGQEVLGGGQQLNNYGPGILGSIGNTVRTAYERHTDDPTLTHYNGLVRNYAPEAQKAIAQTTGGVAERDERAAGYSGSMSQASRAAALQADARQAFDAMGAVNDQYKRLMGHDITDQMSPAARKAYDRIMAGGYDANGKALFPAAGYTPGSEALPSDGGDGPNPSGVGIGSGPGGMTVDPNKQRAAGKIQDMLASGAPDDQIRAFAKAAGASAGSVEANLSFRKAHPDYRGGYDASDLGLVKKPPVAFSLNGGTGPGGAFFMNAAGALTGNTLDNMTADPALARAGLAGATAANPGMSAVGSVVGTGIGAAGAELGLGAAAAKAGIGATPWVARGADTLYGALSGGGAADDGGRGVGAVTGATFGLAGGILGRDVVAPAVGGMFGSANRAFARATRKEGYSNVPRALTPVDAALLSSTKKAGIDDVTQQLTEAKSLGIPMALVDTSPAFATLGGAAVRRSPNASIIAQNALLPRARGQIDRLGQAVTRDLGPVGNVPQISADLSRQAKADADPLYAAFRANEPATSPEIDSLLQTPFGRSSLSKASTIAANERIDPNLLVPNQAGPAPGYAPESLDLIKRGMDTVLEKHRNPMTGRLDLDGNPGAQAQDGVRKQFIAAVDQIAPNYSAARNAYSGPMQSRDHLQAGFDSFTANPNQLGVDITGASTEKLGQMQLGHRAALIDAANKVRYSSNPFDATLGTPAAEQRLSTLYPDNPGVANLLRQRDVEGRLARTNNDILGNSKTAERGIADQTFAGSAIPGIAADAGMMALGHPPVATMSRLGTMGLKGALALGVGKRAVAKADAIAPALFNTNPDDSLALVQGLLTSDDAYRNYINNLASRRGFGMFGAGAGSAGGAALVSPSGS